jgi:hypothetical protein
VAQGDKEYMKYITVLSLLLLQANNKNNAMSNASLMPNVTIQVIAHANAMSNAITAPHSAAFAIGVFIAIPLGDQ